MRGALPEIVSIIKFMRMHSQLLFLARSGDGESIKRNERNECESRQTERERERERERGCIGNTAVNVIPGRFMRVTLADNVDCLFRA
jgi:hypothetical protein